MRCKSFFGTDFEEVDGESHSLDGIFFSDAAVSEDFFIFCRIEFSNIEKLFLREGAIGLF